MCPPEIRNVHGEHNSFVTANKAVVAGPAGRRAPDHFLDEFAFRRVPFFSFWLIFLCGYL